MTGLVDRWAGRLLTIIVILLCGFLFAPLVVVVGSSFTTQFYLDFPPTGFTLKWYSVLWTDPTWREAFVNSLLIAAFSTIIVVVVSTPAAIVLARRGFRASNLIKLFLLAPIMVPTLMYVLGSLLLYAGLDIQPPFWAMGLALGVLTTPYMVTTLLAALEHLDPALEEAARNLGASQPRLWVEIVIPNVRTAFLAGSLICFVLAFDELLVPLFLGGIDTSTLPVRIFEAVAYDLDPSVAAVSSVLILAAASTATVLTTTASGPASLQRP